MKAPLRPSLAILVALAVTLALTWVGAADATKSTSSSRTTHSATPPVAKKVARSPQGSLGARVVGETKSGHRVTGTFVPLHFSKRHGHVRVRGLINGVVHRGNGRVVTFSAMRTLRVKSISGTPITTRSVAGRTSAAAASCDILHLVLAPLDLDLLGLQVHLDRVVLNIVAQSGAGNLLGNLLCAVAGLLDGGLSGLLGRLSSLLNQILGVLRLGV